MRIDLLPSLLLMVSAAVVLADDPMDPASPPPERLFPRADLAATHREVEPIRIPLGPSGKLETIAMDRQGRLLAGVSWIPPEHAPAAASLNPAETPERPRPVRPGARPSPGGRPGGQGPPRQPDDSHLRRYAIQILSPAGELLETWPLPEGVQAKMLHATEDGEVYVGGDQMLARFSAAGELLQSVPLAALLEGRYSKAHTSGMTANDQYLFVALGEGRSLQATEDVVRLQRDLSNPKLIVEKQFGCCSHIDLECRTGELLIAENSRHRVNRYTFDGELIDRWGERDRVSLEGFAACCNPVNFDLGPDGILFTAESGIGRVKKYTPAGEFLGLVGYVDTTEFDRGSYLASISCYIPVEVAPDGQRIYVMDVRQHVIRVLQRVEDGSREPSDE